MPRPKGNDVTLGPISGAESSLVFPRESRDKHLYVAGATGTGKSKFLESLIRQDIRSWFKSKCGMLLLDPHGSLYDSVMEWLARADAKSLPVIPIDLRQDDWVVSYNALRRRSAPDCSVIIDNFVQAMAYVWGASGTDQTPRFARWATNILRTLYENGLTLLEAEYLIDHLDRAARHALSQKVEDRASKRDWQFANQLSPRDFEAEIGSTANRLHRFLRNRHMRSMFGQGSASLDLGRALDEGHIILVSLASAGARVSEEDADLFATLLLSDLWTAALERGKKPGVKPFYLYLDEFQRFITPSLARNLDEARGFGLHLTMANQYPQQLLDQGESGTRLYHSVMENASSKVVFRLHSEENLRPLAQWLFRGVMDPDEIKLELESVKVVGYEEVERTSTTVGRSRGRTRTLTEGDSVADSASRGKGNSASRSQSVTGIPWQWNPEVTRQEGGSESETAAEGTSAARHESESTAEGETETHSETTGTVLMPVMGKELSHVQFRSLEEQLHRAMAALFDQEQRQAAVRLVGMKAPASIRAPEVKTRAARPEAVRRYAAKLLAKWDFALPAAEAAAALAEREKRLEAELRAGGSEEPETARRRIAP